MEVPLLSVIIATYKRSDKINACLQSILANSFSSFKIIVVDQSKDEKTKNQIKPLNTKKIDYFKLHKIGKSRALNLGIKKAQGDILVFTDDDCLVNKDWLNKIYQSFNENEGITGVLGQTLPYRKELHKNEICPAIFLNNKKKIISKPSLHSKNIGFGNNMAFKKEVFIKIGGFKEWLGVGSIGLAGLDAEITLRTLIKHYKIMYNPKIKIYHNRWLTKNEFYKQCLSYTCGEVACYSYFSFQGKRFAKKIVINNFKKSYWKFKDVLKRFFSLKKGSLGFFLCTLEEFYFRFRGLILGFYFSKKDPL